MERSKGKYRLILSAVSAFIFSSLASGAALADAATKTEIIKLRAEQRCEEMMISNVVPAEAKKLLTNAQRALIELSTSNDTLTTDIGVSEQEYQAALKAFLKKISNSTRGQISGSSVSQNDIVNMMAAAADLIVKAGDKETKKEDLEAAKVAYKEAQKRILIEPLKSDATEKMTVPENMKATPDSTVKVEVENAMQHLSILESDIADLKRIWKDLGPYAKNDDVILARKNIANCAERLYSAAVLNEKIASSLVGADSANALVAKEREKSVKNDFVDIAQRVVADSEDLSLFAGPSLVLDGNDKFKTGLEVRALYDGGAGSFLKVGRFISDFSYQTRGTVNQARQPGDPIPQPAGADLFLSDKGYIKFNTGVSFNLLDNNGAAYSAITVTGGLSTIPGNGGDFPEALRPKVAVGLVRRTFLTDGIYARFSLGVAHDEYWRTDVTETVVPATATTAAQLTTRRINSYERGTIEANVLLPARTGGGKFSAAIRLLLDTPLDGKGPSEVRLSLLASMNFNDVFAKIVKASP